MPATPISEVDQGGDTVDTSTHIHGCGCSACQSNKNEDVQADSPDTGSNPETEGAVGDTPATAGSISVGGTVFGNIDYEDDVDLYRVTLQAGETYDISLNGNSLFDPVLELFSSDLTLLRLDDDGGPGLNSQLTYTATTTGTYYISAQSFDYFGTDTGTYTLSVSGSTSNALPAPRNDWANSPNFSSPALDGISWDTQINHNVITVYFAESGDLADGVTAEGFNAYERQQFQEAFELIESVIDIEFRVVNSPVNVDMQLLLDTDEISSLGFFNPPGSSFGGVAGVGVFAGDDWDRFVGGDLQVGGYGFQTIVHELLHGLGLAHPHDTGGSSRTLPGVTSAFDDFGNFDLNQGIYTTMSYNRGLQTGEPGSGPGVFGNTWGVQSGPMALDIAVLQELYGANEDFNSGNDNYVLASRNAAGTYWTSIWDADGIDAIRHTGAGAATIDLRAATLQMEEGGGGFISSVTGIAGGFTIANGVVIERAYGGNSNDRITGNDADNFLEGGGGLDTLFGGDGDDSINGGAGEDSIYAEDGNDEVLGGDGQDLIYGGTGSDTLDGGAVADALFGGLGNDRLVGGSNVGLAKDQLAGGLGDDSLFGGGGFDRLNGDEGEDYLNGGAQADNLFGGFGDDTLLGEGGLDRLFGGAGNDVSSGGDGSDRLFGGIGHDTLSGQTGDDQFYGGGGNDHVFGGSGDDFIRGGGGFDRIEGGTGDDLMLGNFNADVFVFGNGHGNDTISDFNATNNAERLDFSPLSTLNSLNAVLDAGEQVGDDYLIQTGGGNSILLTGVSEAQLGAGDFIF